MATATDPARPVAPPGKDKARKAAPKGTGAAASRPTAEHILGAKSVGVLFTYKQDPTTGEMRAHSCSASVVQSPSRNVILTAAHCTGGKSVFVPWYRTGASLDKQEYGFYRVDKWFVDPRYDKPNTKDKTSDLDFAFARLAKSSNGRNVQDVVGANSLARTPKYNNDVTMVGYPKASHDSADEAVRCPTQTWALPGYYQIQALCNGMYGGVSGGPWFSKIDWSNGTGEIIGNVGGYNGGGNDDDVDWLTYSPMHGDQFFRLYDDAKSDRKVERPDPYQQPAVPYSMGGKYGGETWQHARLMASGDFNGNGHSDLIVVWTDGEVTMYYSDGKGHFTGERQLVAPKDSVWTHAEGITAGDFTGSSQFDLIVTWSDGEVTLYGDVGSNGLNWGGTQMIDPKKTSTWKHATQITAGRFNADKYVTDLMVRWSDGELTLYTNVGAEKKFSEEHKLKDPNKAWEDATLLTAGEYSGSSKWDLLVRWKDGSINSYVGTTVNGLGATHTVHGGNFSTWTHSTVMTTGNFTGNGRTDDLVIRWSDGETTMYIDTQAEGLGTEENLVPAA
ncbi:trypsin-like serine peptidase [Streptomyces orinoci]|uniref:FG-GAP-like repeat-containing protein n=1 Tax=Streptomyces orinoci TaxID=67339 RepID=A0ABV3K4Y5_STRON|nr:FG-GAP-like repeat-containing protein [Streptomyces orinoci]